MEGARNDEPSCVLTLTGKAADAIRMFATGMALYQTTGATIWKPLHLTYLAKAYAELGQLDDAKRCIAKARIAVETTKECWFEAELNRTAGEIALKSAKPDVEQANAYFERSLSIARAAASQSPGNSAPP